MIDLDLDIGLDEPKSSEPPRKTKSRGHVTTCGDLFRRFTSERSLEECLDWQLEPGKAYHVISQGDIDSLSFLKFVLRQQKAEKIYLSTWCMSVQDVEEVERLIELRAIGTVDWFVGEIFPGSYSTAYAAVERCCERHGGRVAVFRNHSKVFAIKGERFDCVIESSANVNTNPRAEQTVITCDSGLYRFYADYYDGIVSFDERWR